MSMKIIGGSRPAITGIIRRVVLALFVLTTAIAAQAAEQRLLVLQHLTADDNTAGDDKLPQGTVMTTLRDSQGFVWLGTEEGLVRYHGQGLSVYTNSPDRPDSLPGNFIWQVVEDANRDLWIAVNGGGVARWRRATDRFEVFRHDDSRPDSLASDSVRTLLIDAQGRIWVGTTDAGVDILDPSTGRVQHLRHGDSAGSLSSDNIFTLRLDRAGDVWIGTEGGLDRWERASGRIVRLGARGSVPRAQVSQVIESADGTFWIGTYNAGLARIDRDGRVLRMEQPDPHREGSLASLDVRALLEDMAGNLWVGTRNGLDLLEPGAARFVHYRRDDADNRTLRDSEIKSLYQDPTGLVWIGTVTGGVSRWNPRSWELGGARPRWLQGQYVMGFAEAAGREVWVASLAGLFRYDPHRGTGTSIDVLLGRANALGDSSATALKEDRQGSLWIGTMRAGLKRLRPDNRLQSFPVGAGKPRSLSAAGVMSIAEARTGRIWVGTYGGGVNIVDPASGEIRQLPFGAARDAVSGAIVTALLEDTQGNIWIGTEGDGLTIVDAEGRLLRSFRETGARTLPSKVIYSLALDSSGRVWVGTRAGIARAAAADVGPAQQRLTAMPLDGGAGPQGAYGLIGDPRGGMWVSGSAGLVRLDPESGATRHYHRMDGLHGEEFTTGAVQRLADGRLCFGGPGGFNIFDPEQLSGSRAPPALLLNDIMVMGESQQAETPVWLRQELALTYRENIAALDFAVLDFVAHQHARLSYLIAGQMKEPIELDARKSIPLNNLPAGNHVVEVRAAGPDSGWSAPLRFKVHRDAHPLLSPLAYALYALLIGLAIALTVRHQRNRIRNIERARDLLETQVKERTVELVESNRQLAEAARAKSDFLDRMSHELRTPMNGVVGMTELLSRTSLSSTQTHLTKTIRASAQILLQIVNDLLDLSKIRAGKVQLEALPVDLGQVLEECTSLFAGAAENKGLELIVCPPRDAGRALRGDPLRVRQVLMNLVGNAVKFTAQGEIVVRADVEQIGGDSAMVRLSVYDTGIGIDAAVLAKIFEPFTQADEKTTRQFGGTGLGLSICRELAELMGGRITVESRQQIGSTFTLHLPMQLGAPLPVEPRLPVAAARLCTRRTALAESLQRHCAAFGFTLAWDPQGPAEQPAEGELLLIDAATQEQLLMHCLARPELCRGSLVVIATAAEVERFNLRLLLPERAVVLKPVHHVALREALAAALGKPELVQAAASQPALQAVRGHVLVVEDDPVNAAVAQGYLAELGCSCVWVSSAEAAIARHQTEHFDLVFMDLNMSDMDGFAATARIREREAGGRRMPIVALTAHEACAWRERVLAGGMDDILGKPYSIEDCRAMLARWISASASATPDADDDADADADAGALAVDALAVVDDGAVRSLGQLGTGRPEALYARLAALFESSSQPVMERLEVALRGNDLNEAANLCHRLKSSSANVGASAFAAGLRELEQLCRAGDAAAAADSHRRLAAAYQPLLQVLRSRRMAESA